MTLTVNAQLLLFSLARLTVGQINREVSLLLNSNFWLMQSSFHTNTYRNRVN